MACFIFFIFITNTASNISASLKKYFLQLLFVIAMMVENARAIKIISSPFFVYCKTLDYEVIHEA